jgi:hypothetical protein
LILLSALSVLLLSGFALAAEMKKEMMDGKKVMMDGKKMMKEAEHPLSIVLFVL